jgi:hypothetical protein
VSAKLARIYPGVFDAVLVIACVAAIAARDGRWWARGWAWLVVIVVLGAIGTADVLHAGNYALRHRLTEGVVAAAPVVAVLLAFSLLLTMLRQSRPRPSDAARSLRGSTARRAARRAAREQSAAPAASTPIDTVPVGAVSVVAAGTVPRPPAPPIALPPAPEEAEVDEPVAVADQAADAPAPIADTAEIPVFTEDAGQADQVLPDSPNSPDSTDAPTREEPGIPVPEPTPVTVPDDLEVTDAAAEANAPETPDAVPVPDGPVAADGPNPATEPADAVAAEAPSSAGTGPNASEPVAEPSPEQELPPAGSPQPAPQGIRYASSAAAAEDWESEVDPDLAGQVYPVLTSDPDIDTSGYPDEPQEVDDADAPPFATAPFASVPRLNRMRVSPIPPTDSDDED